MSEVEPDFEGLFNAARGLKDLQQRQAFLAAALPNQPAMRLRLERLLEIEPEADVFFNDLMTRGGSSTADVQKADQANWPPEPSSALVAGKPHQVDEALGTILGRYKLLQKIGEGGCGEVYMAEQISPVIRRVALKVIKLGMDTKSVIARFEAEQQALALMDHPNIAKVFDAGSTSEGRPFFVMELVRGKPITQYCDQNKLSTEDRLKIFTQVCDAIQHAHQKGIIHRDIKPSNVLVTVNDGIAVPKVIDFGIAKATGGRLTEHTLFTAFELFIGTPAYVSPEQADMTSVDVDTRSDIYSLGVLLYELLTGKTPFDAPSIAASGLEEMRRVIREQEPLRPSTRLQSFSCKELTTTAQHRQSEGRKLIQRLAGDLDWIVMKCLEKERARRYATANALAADLQRHVQSEPVLARPPSKLYRARKLARRHRLVFISGITILGVLLLAVFISTGQAIRARQAEREQARLRANAERVQQEEELLRKEADFAREKAQTEAKRAEDAAAEARLHAYAADIANAQQALLENDLGRARQLLSLYTNTGPFRALRGFEWGYLWHATRGRESAVLSGHARGVHSLLWSHALDSYLSVSADTTLRRWNSHTLQCEDTIPLPMPNQNGAAVAPDGQTIAVWGADGLIVFDLGKRTVLRSLHGYFDDACFQFSANGEFLVGGHNVIQAIDMRGMRPPIFLVGASSPVAFSPDGSRLAARSGDGVGFWSTRTWEPADDPPRRDAEPSFMWRDLAFSPDGRLIAAGTSSGHVWVWRVSSTEPIARLTNQDDSFIFDVKFSPDGVWLASAGGDQTVWLWPTTNWTKGRALIGHQSEVWSLQFSEDSRKLLTGSADKTIRVWDLNGSSEQDTFSSGDFRGVSDDNKAFVTMDTDDRNYLIAQQVSFENGQILARIQFPRNDYSHSVVSPDGRWVVPFGPSGEVTAFDFATGKKRGSSKRLDSNQSFRRFVDRNHILTVSNSGQAILWSVPDLVAIPLAAGISNALSASRDFIFTRLPSARHMVEVRDIITGKIISVLQGHEEPVVDVEVAPDGKSVATASWDTTVRIWDLPGGEQRHVFHAQREGVYAVAYSPDGRSLAATGADGTVTVWHLATGRKLLTLPKVGRPCFRLAFGHAALAAEYTTPSQIKFWKADEFDDKF